MRMITHSKPWITTADFDAVESVLLSNMIARGDKVANFSSSLLSFLGLKDGVVLSSGSSALLFALKTLGVAQGSEVILPTYVCHSVYDAVVCSGATPVLCDVGTDWIMTTETIEPCISSRTSAIIVVHIFGIIADVPSIKRFGVPIIEDCCQAFGADVNGHRAGSVGEIGVYSFNAIKCLSTGEGGFAGTSSGVLAENMKIRKDTNMLFSPLTDLQAALGLSQLERYTEFLNRRKQLALRYFAELPESLTRRLQINGGRSMFFRFPLESDLDFDVAQGKFSGLGVAVRRGVDDLLHRRINLPDALFSNATRHYNRTLSIPIYPALNDGEQEQVIQAVKTVFEQK